MKKLLIWVLSFFVVTGVYATESFEEKLTNLCSSMYCKNIINFVSIRDAEDVKWDIKSETNSFLKKYGNKVESYRLKGGECYISEVRKNISELWLMKTKILDTYWFDSDIQYEEKTSDLEKQKDLFYSDYLSFVNYSIITKADYEKYHLNICSFAVKSCEDAKLKKAIESKREELEDRYKDLYKIMDNNDHVKRELQYVEEALVEYCLDVELPASSDDTVKETIEEVEEAISPEEKLQKKYKINFEKNSALYNTIDEALAKFNKKRSWVLHKVIPALEKLLEKTDPKTKKAEVINYMIYRIIMTYQK